MGLDQGLLDGILGLGGVTTCQVRGPDGYILVAADQVAIGHEVASLCAMNEL